MKKSSSSLFQTCPNCPVDETRRVFSVGSGSPVVRCRSCGIEFTREYPDIAGKWEEIYPARYFERALASSEYREKIFEELLKELESILGRSGRWESDCSSFEEGLAPRGDRNIEGDG